jgi:hypothetical protein
MVALIFFALVKSHNEQKPFMNKSSLNMLNWFPKSPNEQNCGK